MGATALSVAGLALLIAFASLAMYFVGRQWLERRLKEAVQREIDVHERELRGRLVGYVGFMFGRLRDLRPEFIDEAIRYSELAYTVLPATSDWKMASLNNTAFYYSVRGYRTDAPAAIKYAKTALEDYAKSGNINRLTTYASVVARYYNNFDNPKKALQEAETMMQELQDREDITPTHKQSAARHLEKIRAALAEF